MADERINNITEGILTMHPLKTNDMTYTAIFATASIPQLVKYYDCFKTKKTDLKIAAIFTYGPNEDYEGKDELSCQSLERKILQNQMLMGKWTSHYQMVYMSTARILSLRCKIRFAEWQPLVTQYFIKIVRLEHLIMIPQGGFILGKTILADTYRFQEDYRRN